MAKKPKEENNTGSQIEVKSPDFLAGGGDMGELIRSKDWSNTALGAPHTWSQSLRTTVSLCIASNFPIAIIWGTHRVQIYNDGYWPITGDMHPTAMGQDFAACWHSAWPVIGQAFEEAFLGQTRFLENQRIFLDRYGYKEETFFTFSFSPILDESGKVGGLFHPVIELTQQTLAERRLKILSTVANHTVKARTADEAIALIVDCLKDFELDIPFVLLYSLSADGKEANLEGSVGVEKDSSLAPAKINLEEQALKSWPFTEVIQNEKPVQVEKLSDIFGTFNCGPYPEPPEQALVFPVIIPSAAHNKYFLVAGVSSRRLLDEKYLLFYELLAASVTNELAKARVYEEERKKAEALTEIDKAKTLFFSNISHEFRTPLTLMLSPLEELLNQKKNNFNEIERENIATTHRNAMRLLKLVNTLLDFSRIESGKEQASFSLVDIVVLTKNLASNFRSVIEKAGLELIVIADSSIQPVYVDKQMWEKIVFNLLSNAFKYTLEGKITVELLAEKDFAVLKLKDTGLGIPEIELPRMFERFHRVQNVTGRTYEGTGIGLSLIKELVKMHQGTIQVESKLNEGSVFTIKIPFGKEHLDANHISKTDIDSDEIYSNIYVEEIATLLVTDKPGALKTASGEEENILPTIIVVDDNADMREHISSILSNNFNVITANNGMDALHKMKETIPALVLTDIMMPVMDGIGLLKEIKSNKSTENIPVIFLTARAGEESKIEGWETGADDYLVKPFSSKELISRIASQIKTQQIRVASETMLKNIFMQAPVAISVVEVPEYKYLLVNPEAQKLFRRSAEQVLGKTVKELFPEAEDQGLLQIFDQVLSTGVTFAVNEMPLKLDYLNDGVLHQRYLNFSVEAIKNLNGKVHSLLVVCVDLTQQVAERKKIEESEKRFQLLVQDATAAIIVLTGPEMKVEIVNEAYGRLINLKPDDLLGKSLFSVIPEAVEYYGPLLENVRLTGEMLQLYDSPYSVTVNGKQIDGFLHVVYQPYRDTDGNIIGVMAIIQDVTASVLASKKIEESEKKFAAAILAVEGIIWTKNSNGEMIGEQPGWTKLTGQCFEEYQGYGWIKVVHPDDAKPTLEAWNNAVEKRSTFEFEHRLKTKQDGWRIFSVKAVPAFDENGDILQWIGVHTDITEQREAAQKIKESEERFKSLADESPIFVFIIDPDPLAPVSYNNKTWLNYTGQTAAQAAGTAWNGIIHPEDVPLALEFYVPAFTARQPYFIPAARVLRFDGEYRWHSFKGNPRYLPNGEFNGFIGVGFDIHEQKLAEEKKDVFISIASHELKTPLTTAKAYLQMLELCLDVSTGNANLYAKKASQSVNRLNELISELLDVSKMRLGKLNYSVTTFNFNDMVDSTIENMQLISSTHTIIKTGKVSNDVLGDKDRLQQVLINLLTNAIKYSPGAEKVFIHVEQENDLIKVSVKDNGIGIAKQSLNKIFDKYHRIEEHAIHFQGLGIGLFISYEIIKRHQGKLWADSEPGKGSTFYFTLPVANIEQVQ